MSPSIGSARRSCESLPPGHLRGRSRALPVRVAWAGAWLTLVCAVHADETGAARSVAAPTAAKVECGAGLLSVDAAAVPMRALLEEIARRCGLTLALHGDLRAAVTTRIDRSALAEALPRLLRATSYVLRRDGPSAGSLWVFGAGETDLRAGPEPTTGFAQTQPAPDRAAAERLLTVAALADRDADPFASELASAIVDDSLAVRMEAVYALGEIEDGASTQLLAQALLDPDVIVREAAVDALAQLGGEASASALAPVFQDPDPGLRENAVYALGEIGGTTANELLRAAAASDPDEYVRGAAANMLEELDRED